MKINTNHTGQGYLEVTPSNQEEWRDAFDLAHTLLMLKAAEACDFLSLPFSINEQECAKTLEQAVSGKWVFPGCSGPVDRILCALAQFSRMTSPTPPIVFGDERTGLLPDELRDLCRHQRDESQSQANTN